MKYVALKVGGDREKLRVSSGKPGPNQVRFTESVTMATDLEVKLPHFVKQVRVNPLSRV